MALGTLLEVSFLVILYLLSHPGLEARRHILVVLTQGCRKIQRSVAVSKEVRVITEHRLWVADRVHQRKDVIFLANHLLEEDSHAEHHRRLEEAVIEVPCQYREPIHDKLVVEAEHAARHELHLPHFVNLRVIHFF